MADASAGKRSRRAFSQKKGGIARSNSQRYRGVWRPNGKHAANKKREYFFRQWVGEQAQSKKRGVK
jgi:hypothetical protein